jgi:hypothetical protein
MSVPIFEQLAPPIEENVSTRLYPWRNAHMATGAKHPASAEVDMPPIKRWGKCSANSGVFNSCSARFMGQLLNLQNY